MAIIEFTEGLEHPSFAIIATIAAISIAFSLFTQWFQKRFSTSRESQMDMQMQIEDLKSQINDARGNQELMMQLNQEMMVLFQKMSKKQLVPMLIRSVLWFGLLGLLNLFFGGYDEYIPFSFLGRTLFALYLIVSLGFSLVMFGVKALWKKYRPSEGEQKEEVVIDHLRALRGNTVQPLPESHESPSEPSPPWDAAPQPSTKSWKSNLDDN